MAEGGIVPPHSVLAPGAALGLLPQQSPTLRPGQLPCSKGQYPPESHQNKKGRESYVSAGCSIWVAAGNLRSLPLGPTRVRPWMRGSASNHQARPHDALYGVALTVRNSHQINPHRPGHAGRAARGYRGRSLAKECVGSKRIGKERLQFPAAKRRQPDESKNHTSKSHDTGNAISCDQAQRNRRLRRR